MIRKASPPTTALEQGYVGDERDDAETDRDRDVDRLGLVELARPRVEAGQLREEEVDPDEQHDDATVV